MMGLPAYLLGKQGVRDARFLSEILFLVSSFRMQHFNYKSAREVKFSEEIFSLTVNALNSIF